MEEWRLQKYLAHSGIASRRAAEDIIAEGRVFVNGKRVTDPATKVTLKDRVTVDGKTVK
ncbi:MAG: rRNA pseudouridine synthase, partial [Clostridia bacterium]|nr:rRNA pseudouridine synthase [Clostridia bacterium]